MNPQTPKDHHNFVHTTDRPEVRPVLNQTPSVRLITQEEAKSGVRPEHAAILDATLGKGPFPPVPENAPATAAPEKTEAEQSGEPAPLEPKPESTPTTNQAGETQTD